MRVLLDECVPSQLARELRGHEVRSVVRLHWSGIKNGELLRRAESEYDVFLTIDQALESEHPEPLKISIITLKASSNRIESLLPHVPKILEMLGNIKAGERLRLP